MKICGRTIHLQGHNQTLIFSCLVEISLSKSVWMNKIKQFRNATATATVSLHTSQFSLGSLKNCKLVPLWSNHHTPYFFFFTPSLFFLFFFFSESSGVFAVLTKFFRLVLKCVFMSYVFRHVSLSYQNSLSPSNLALSPHCYWFSSATLTCIVAVVQEF